MTEDLIIDGYQAVWHNRPTLRGLLVFKDLLGCFFYAANVSEAVEQAPLAIDQWKKDALQLGIPIPDRIQLIKPGT